MSQTLRSVAPTDALNRPRGRATGLLRLVGPLLLVVLLWRLDLQGVVRLLAQANPLLVALSILAIVPLIGVKTVRWQLILRAQQVTYPFVPALLAYFGSLFIGFLTPGRLGEFVKALHVQQSGAGSAPQAFASVLADRLFDLALLLAVGVMAILTLPGATGAARLAALALPVGMVTALGLFLHDGLFAYAQAWGTRMGGAFHRLLGEGSWLAEMRQNLRCLSGRQFGSALALTIGAYAVFFGQCYLLALALDLPSGFVPVTFAVALGSLVTLAPISISGLGTREAAMIAYLSTVGVPAEGALAFSLLVFVTFYLGGGLLGLVAWWIQPAPLAGWRRA